MPKPGAKFRCTVFLRKVRHLPYRTNFPCLNCNSNPPNWPLKHAFHLLIYPMDTVNSLWKNSYKRYSHFLLLMKIFTKKSPTWNKSAVAHLHSSLAGIIPANLRASILYWLEDIILYSITVKDLFESVRSFMERFAT